MCGALYCLCTHTVEALWPHEIEFMFLCVGHDATYFVAPVSILSAEVLWLSVLLLLFSHKLKTRVVCKWINICNDKDKAQECICVFIHVSACWILSLWLIIQCRLWEDGCYLCYRLHMEPPESWGMWTHTHARTHTHTQGNCYVEIQVGINTFDLCFYRKYQKILMFFGWSKRWGRNDTLLFRPRFVLHFLLSHTDKYNHLRSINWNTHDSKLLE